MIIVLYAKIADVQNAIQVSGQNRSVRLVLDVVSFQPDQLEKLWDLVGDIKFQVQLITDGELDE